MASYPPQIIQNPVQQPFNAMQNPIINAYFTAALGEKFKQREEARKEENQSAKYKKALEYAKANKDPNMKYSYSGSGGMGFETVTPKTDDLSINDITMAYIGAASPEKYKTIGERMKLAPELSDNPQAAMSLMTGGEGDVYGNPAPPNQDYRQSVMTALQGNQAIPVERMLQKESRLAEQAQIKQELATMPAGLDADLQAAASTSAGDPSKFIEGLKGLAPKYLTSDAALKKIKMLIDLNQEKASQDDTSLYDEGLK
jgi:hypothetical protein